MTQKPGRLVAVLFLTLACTAALAATAAAGSSPQQVAADPFIGPDAAGAPAARLALAADGGLRKGDDGGSDDKSSDDKSSDDKSGDGKSGKVRVDDDGAECPDSFTTIQAAVDSGAKKIEICAGTYPENVLIGPGADVELRGKGAAVVHVTGVAGTAGPIIDVLPGSDVEIEKLTVDGGSAMAGGTVYGIRYAESDGKIKDVEVLNVRNPAGNSQGVGIRVESSGTRAKVKVEKSLVSNYTRVGINGNGAGVEIDVAKNLVNGPVLPRVWAPNGIQISRGAEGKVHGNVVDNNPSPNPPGGGGSGIILFCAGDTDVHDNAVSDSDLGISLADNSGAKVHGNVVRDSIFDAISLQYIGSLFGNTCGVSPTDDNEVSKNTLLDSADTGISTINFEVVFGFPITAADSPMANRIRSNKIEDSGFDGIHVWSGVDNKLEKNKIKSSGATDAVDDTVGGGTAGTANTWKKNKCATSLPGGLCG